jgi:2-hydroxy-6-oxonona-2,4-dienedioate hydrolase
MAGSATEFIEIDGGRIAYELLGPADGQKIVLTPGGRFSKDVPGLRPLAEALADGGMRVLLWDRPNCGLSDVKFTGQSESHMRADTLAGLLRALDHTPTIIAGGSGGARDSLLTTIRYPELATKVAVWSIVGGVYSQMSLAAYYVLPNIQVAEHQGIEAVLEMPEWKGLIEANPRNEQRLRDLGAEEFRRVMLRWLTAYVPKPDQAIPGVNDHEFEAVTVPTLIVRGGEHDSDHPKRTSMDVHCLIAGSELVEPPWPEDAWEQAVRAMRRGTGNIFDPWVQAAPLLLEFAKR